jgi:hypothetical protein
MERDIKNWPSFRFCIGSFFALWRYPFLNFCQHRSAHIGADFSNFNGRFYEKYFDFKVKVNIEYSENGKSVAEESAQTNLGTNDR